MKLSSEQTRIAMPVGVCPHCSTDVGDWHAEWTVDPRLATSFNPRGALDCPVCGGLVLADGLDVIKTENLPVLKRLRSKAEAWAENGGQGDLQGYLERVEPAYTHYNFAP